MEEIKRRDITWSPGTSEMGKSTINITCPFCFEDIEVYVWSFHGCGKRCDCGAKLTPWIAFKK